LHVSNSQIASWETSWVKRNLSLHFAISSGLGFAFSRAKWKTLGWHAFSFSRTNRQIKNYIGNIMKRIMNHVIFTITLGVITAVAYADDQVPLTGQQFVWDAGAAGMKEVSLGQVALEKSQNPEVMSFAKHMVRDHSSANKKLMEIANDEALDFPPTNLFSTDVTNSPDLGSNGLAAPFNSSAGIGTNNMKGAEQLMQATQSATNNELAAVRQLEASPEPKFDQAFASQMVADHAAAIQLFEQATNDVPDKVLKKFAVKTLPVLHKHYEMAQDLENKLSGGQNANPPAAGETTSMTGPAGNPQ